MMNKYEAGRSFAYLLLAPYSSALNPIHPPPSMGGLRGAWGLGTEGGLLSLNTADGSTAAAAVVDHLGLVKPEVEAPRVARVVCIERRRPVIAVRTGTAARRTI